MNERHQLNAFYATLAAICYLVTVGAVLAYNGRSVEAIGVAAAITGLIGIARMPSRSPVATTQDGDVNVTKEPTP